MNLQTIFSFIGLSKEEQVTEGTLVKMLRKRLLLLHDVYVWKREEAKLIETYMQTLPYILLLGKKLDVQPWTVKVELTPSIFDKNISESLVFINTQCNCISDEKYPQICFEFLLHEYLMIGLNIGMSPKQMEKELLTKSEINDTLNLQLRNHQIKERYLNRSIEEQINIGI